MPELITPERERFRRDLRRMTLLDIEDIPTVSQRDFGATFGEMRATRLTTTGLRLTCKLVPRRAAPLVTNAQLQRAQLELLTCANVPTAYGYPSTTITNPDDASQVVVENAR